MTPTQTRLVLTHQGRVRLLAVQLGRRLPPNIEIDDLIADGCVGLLHAARTYEAARGVQFWTYAHHKVYFAMIDGLRQEQGRRRYRQYGTKIRPFVQPLGDCYFSDGTPKAEDAPALVDPHPSPESLAAETEQQRLVAAAIERLPPRDARVLRLHLSGQTVASIAVQLGLSSARVSVLRRRAVQRVREAVAA